MFFLSTNGRHELGPICKVNGSYLFQHLLALANFLRIYFRCVQMKPQLKNISKIVLNTSLVISTKQQSHLKDALVAKQQNKIRMLLYFGSVIQMKLFVFLWPLNNEQSQHRIVSKQAYYELDLPKWILLTEFSKLHILTTLHLYPK